MYPKWKSGIRSSYHTGIGNKGDQIGNFGEKGGIWQLTL
jgi:hypothetical protein